MLTILLTPTKWSTLLFFASLKACAEPRFGLDQIVEHVPVNSRERLDALALHATDSPEPHGVGVIALERDLDEVHFSTPANLKAEAVFGLRERVSPEHEESGFAYLLIDDFCYVTHSPMTIHFAKLSAFCWVSKPVRNFFSSPSMV